MISFLSLETRRELSKHLSDEQIARLQMAISNLLAAPPAPVPTVIQAKEQIELLRSTAYALERSLNAAPWVEEELSRRAFVDAGTLHRFSPRELRKQLSALRAAARRAAGDLEQAPQVKRSGRPPDPLVRFVIRAVLQSLEAAGVPLTKTGIGTAAECCDAIFRDLASLDSYTTRFRGVSAENQVREMLRSD